MKKAKLMALLSILCFGLVLCFSSGQAAWLFNATSLAVEPEYVSENRALTENQYSSAAPVCYITDGSNKEYFTTIEKGLQTAGTSGHGSIVVAVPPEGSNYHSTSNNVSFTAKAVYSITKSCTIKSGVTFIIPTDNDTIASISSSSLTSYIKSMKEDDHSRGTTGYGAYATDSTAKFLRVTINVGAGVQITNKGTLIVSGYLNSGTSSGGLVGNTSHSYSQIILGANAKITQDESSAITYCYGYISEATENNQSSVLFAAGKLYVPFVIDDYRGFSFSWAMTASNSDALKNKYCSPFNQFELRNIDSAVTLRYGTQVMGNITIYLTYPTMNIDQTFPKELYLVGTSTTSSNKPLVQLDDPSYSSLNYKFSKAANDSQIDFYGGMTLNPLAITLSASIVTVNLSTGDSYFPLSYRQRVSLSKASGQTANALYSFTNQKIKVLPGSHLVVNNGAELSGKSLVSYTSFYDGALGNGHSSSNDYGSFKYPIKPAGIVKIQSGGKLTCTTSIGGTIYGDSSGIVTPSTQTITANEAWSVGSNNGNPNPAWRITDYLQLQEALQILPLSYAEKPKLFVGFNTFLNYNSYKPGVQVIADNGSPITINDSQKVLHFDSISSYRIVFVKNIFKAYKYQTAYGKGETVSYNSNNAHFCAINSTMSISNNNSGVNEFNVQSVTVVCTTPTVDNHIPLYPDSEIQLQANVVDKDKAYNKTVTWQSSDTSKATVNSSGAVSGLALGSVRITATCDGVSGYIDLEVINEPSSVVEVSSFYIRDNKGNTSQNDPTLNASDSSFLAHAQYSNGSTITFYPVVAPADAPYSSIKWTFTASAEGRQYMNDYTQKTETSNAESVTIHIVSGSGKDDDKCTLKCEITDLKGNKFSSTFVINHKKDVSLCVTDDTLVTLADGSKVAIKDIKGGDMALAFDHETGALVPAPVIFNEKEEAAWRNVIHLEFDNGSKVGVISEHGFFDMDTLRYECIDETNYDGFVGHRFYCEDGTTAVLEKAYVAKEYTECYSLPTFYHLNFFAEGILSMPGGIQGLFNIYEYGEDLKYDEEAYGRDVAEYGLFEYADLEPYGVTEEMFDAYGGKNLKVALGKGVLTEEYLAYLIERYGKYTD